MTARSTPPTGPPLRGALLGATTAFADREVEFRWLESYLDETVSGVPRIILIEGDAGIGKSRLLQELRSLAIGRGVSVAQGRAVEHVELPYLVVAEALRSRILQEGDGADAILGESAEAVRSFLRLSGGTQPSATTGSLSDPSAAGLRLDISNAVIALARRRATLLVLDDLHWADTASLELLAHLAFALSDAAALRGVPLMIAASHRPVDRDTDRSIATRIARLQREEICRPLELAGVPEHGVRELLEGLLPGRPAQQLVQSVAQETMGNPLFVRELLRHLVGNNAIAERGGTLVSTQALDVPLPADVVASVSERVDDVSEACRRLLSVASMIGVSFSLEMLLTVADQTTEELLPLLQEAEREGLVGAAGALFRFEHPLIRRVFQDRLARSERGSLHVAIAEGIQKVHGEAIDDHDLEIAHHLIAAESVANAATTCDYATRAGHRSFHNLAWGEAARFYAAAAAACMRAGVRPVRELAELHYMTGLSHYRNMDGGPALDHYARAIELFRKANDVGGRARAQMERARVHITLSSVPYGEKAEADELEAALLELPDGEMPLKGLISAQLAEIYWHARLTDRALDAAARAIRLSESVDDDTLRIYANVAAGTAHTQALLIEEALVCYEQALADAMRGGDIWTQGWPLQRLLMVQLWLGRLADSQRTAGQACELSRQSGDWGELSLGLAGLLAAAAATGAFDDAERHGQETLRMVRRSGYPWGGASGMLALAGVRLQKGQFSEAEEALDILLEPGRIFTRVGAPIELACTVFRQLLRAQAGAPEIGLPPDAGEYARNVVALGGLDVQALALYCALIELADLLEKPELVDAPYEALLTADERGVLLTSTWIFLVPRVLGVGAARRGWWDKAQAHFERAIEQADAAGIRPELARARLDYARMLTTRGSGRDRRAAVEQLDRAMPELEALAMTPWVATSRRLAEELHVLIPELHLEEAEQRPLSAEETRLFDSLHRGRDDDHIADELAISTQSASARVSKLLHKLGAETRQALINTEPAQRPREESPALAGERLPSWLRDGTIIILFTDLEQFTELVNQLGDSHARRVIAEHDNILRRCLREHDGFEIQHTGDGMIAAFGSVRNALSGTIAIHRSFDEFNRSHPQAILRIRAGLNAGDTLVHQDRLFGAAVIETARICARAVPGTILASGAVRELASSEPFRFVARGSEVLKGFEQPLALFEIPWQEVEPEHPGAF